jgi:phosphohistidine phosphatase
MTRLLTLIRHAKSSWSDPDLADVDRPLNPRGKRDAPRMGRRLEEAGVRPDVVLSSPAKRARRTAKAVMRELSRKPAFAVEPSLYMADPDEMLDLVRRLGDSVEHVALVGHNPGMTELVQLLGAASIDNVPTAGVVRFEFDTDSWSEIGPGRARFIAFDYPKRAAD